MGMRDEVLTDLHNYSTISLCTLDITAVALRITSALGYNVNRT